MPKIGVVGLGRIGGVVAANLVADGHEVLGYRRGSMDELVAAGGRPAGSVVELARECDVALSCLPTVSALEEVTVAVAEGARPGGVLVDLSTFGLDAKYAARGRLAAAGVAMLDAPVSGTPAMVRDRRGVVMASGDPEAFARVEGLLGALGAARFVGPFGTGSKLKYVANTLIAIHTAAAAEAIALARATELEPELLIDLLGASAAGSAMLQARGALMARGDGFRPAGGSVAMLRKDLESIREVCGQAGARTPMLDAATALYDEADRRGLGEDDIAVLVTLLEASGAPSRP